MKLNKKYSILSILTLISSPTYSQLYMCKACPGGTYAASGASSCTSCSAGTYSYAGASSCTPCPAGQYQNATGQSSCKNCRAGSYSTGRASSCTSCPAGKYQASAGQSYCNTCPAGTYQEWTGQASCKSCWAGTYQDATGQSGCKSCPAGTYQDATGQSGCNACPTGTYSTGNASSCTQCSAGYYQDATGQSGCKPCPAGTYSATLGATSVSACISCPDYQWSNEGSASCGTIRVRLDRTDYDDPNKGKLVGRLAKIFTLEELDKGIKCHDNTWGGDPIKGYEGGCSIPTGGIWITNYDYSLKPVGSCKTLPCTMKGTFKTGRTLTIYTDGSIKAFWGTGSGEGSSAKGMEAESVGPGYVTW